MRARPARLPRAPRSCRVYTPPELAAAMVKALDPSPDDTWLEPCVGAGVFLEALSASGVRRDRVRGIDLAPRGAPSDALARTLRGTEFLQWATSTEERFTKIVANPPYIALHRLGPSIRKAACSIRTLREEPVPLRANSWYAFLCASLNILRPGGSICFLLPAAWDYANYASHLRDVLPLFFSHVEVHRSQVPLFDTVQDGSVVLVGRRFGSPSRSVLRAEYSSTESLIEGLTSRVLKEFTGARTNAPARQASEPRCDSGDNHGLTRLGDVIEIGLGVVTGDAPYFLLTDDQRRQRGLPRESVSPALTHAHHLTHAAMTRGRWKALRDSGERVWLFRPTPQPARLPSVKRYLSLKTEKGGCHRRRLKVKSRKPWYRPPLPERIDGFLSGMSRRGPWICLQAMRELRASNTLYVVRFPRGWSRDSKAAWSLALLTSQTADNLRAAGRRYADGLVKFEPGDLADLRIPAPPKTSGAYRVYRKAVANLLAGRLLECRRLADRWFMPTARVIDGQRGEVPPPALLERQVKI